MMMEAEWSDTSTDKGMSRIAGSHQKLGEAGWVLALNMEAAQFC
jgi:hypothetical protein